MEIAPQNQIAHNAAMNHTLNVPLKSSQPSSPIAYVHYCISLSLSLSLSLSPTLTLSLSLSLSLLLSLALSLSLYLYLFVTHTLSLSTHPVLKSTLAAIIASCCLAAGAHTHTHPHAVGGDGGNQR